jgi:hypothetical protein
MQRTLAVLLIGALLLTFALACGRKPTEPKADSCVKVDTLWADGKAVLLIKTYYTPPCPVKP